MTDLYSSSKPQKDVVFSTKFSHPQYFSFPIDVIKFLLKNISSPDLYQKLIQTCKYFYSKKRTVVYKYGVIYDKHANEWRFHPSKLIEYKRKYQLWLEKNLSCDTYYSSAVSEFLPRIYKCNLEFLYLTRQKLTFDEYLFLVSSKTIKNFSMTYITICYADGSYVPFEKIFEQLLNALNCEFQPNDNHESYFTAETAKNLLKFPVLKNMATLKLCRISEIFDYTSFIKFIKNNFELINNGKSFGRCYYILFYYETPNQYRKEFEKSVEEMLNTWHASTKKPRVVFISY